MQARSRQSCPTLCDPVGYSPPGSSVHGILQARILEGAAMLSSRGSSQPGWNRVSYASCTDGQVGCLPLAPPGKLCEGACRSTDISDSRQFLLLQGSFNQPRPGSVAGSSLLSHMRELPQDRFFLVHTGVKLPPTESWRVR